MLAVLSAVCVHAERERSHLDDNPFSRGEKGAIPPRPASREQRVPRHSSTAAAESPRSVAAQSSRDGGDPGAGGFQGGKSGSAGIVSELPFRRLHPPLEAQPALGSTAARARLCFAPAGTGS